MGATLCSKSPNLLVCLADFAAGQHLVIGMLRVGDYGCPICHLKKKKKQQNFQVYYASQIPFVIFIFVERNRTERNTTAEKRKQLYRPVLFVANRMLKWQICKFVSEKSLVFIFISQSGFLLAEQQARKRPILTT